MSKKVDDDRSDKEVLKEYQGVHLVEKEFKAMKDLEKVIGEIPYLEDFAYDENGFSAENGHVKNLNLSNLELDHIHA